MYWIVWKSRNGKREYVFGTDEFGYPKHTEDKNKAWKFKDFGVAMSYYDLGYCISKEC